RMGSNRTSAFPITRTGAPPANEAVGNGFAIAEAESMRIIPDEVNNALVILATEPQYRQIKSALRKLDVVPLQVLIEATLADVTLTDELSYGVEWFFTNSVGDNTAVTRLGSPVTLPLEDFSGFTFGIVSAAGAVKALLRALATERKLDILASPSLMVLNNQAANINIGDEVPVVTQQQQSTLGTSNIINSVERQRTGVLLTVTPRVNKGGLVIMEIVQNVSNVARGDETSTALGPTIQNREITSTVAVQSGETLVLGGLIREVNEFTESGIPILRKLPLVGPLFRSTTRNDNRTELIVLITPRAVQNMPEARMITEELRSKMQGIRPWPLDEAPAPSPPADGDSSPAEPLTAPPPL
ncbi:MAG: type II secretion system protein GspD, partial [Gammaproteobacteria bacterium]